MENTDGENVSCDATPFGRYRKKFKHAAALASYYLGAAFYVVASSLVAVSI